MNCVRNLNLLVIFYMFKVSLILFMPFSLPFSNQVPGCEAFEDRAANGWTPARSRAMSTDVELEELLLQLKEAETIDAQADILHFLYNTRYRVLCMLNFLEVPNLRE